MTLAVNIRRSSKKSNKSARAARRRRWFLNDLRAIPLLFYRPDCVKPNHVFQKPFLCEKNILSRKNVPPKN
jgi:hypothetical protein